MLIGSDGVWNFRQPLVDGQPSASLREVPRYIAEQRLLTVPDVKQPFAGADPDSACGNDADDDEEEADIKREIAACRCPMMR